MSFDGHYPDSGPEINPSVSASARLRAAWLTAMTFALRECHPDDADQIVAAWIEGRLTDGPQPDVFGTLQADAAWWAETAPQVEVQAYVRSGMECLASKALGRTTRLRLMAQLWNGLSAEDRAEFIKRVGGKP